MWCEIYRSSKKSGAYLYVEEEGDFSAVPEQLVLMLGQLEHVMRLELKEGRTLAQVDVRNVCRHLAEEGFYLQLPSKVYQQI